MGKAPRQDKPEPLWATEGHWGAGRQGADSGGPLRLFAELGLDPIGNRWLREGDDMISFLSLRPPTPNGGLIRMGTTRAREISLSRFSNVVDTTQVHLSTILSPSRAHVTATWSQPPCSWNECVTSRTRHLRTSSHLSSLSPWSLNPKHLPTCPCKQHQHLHK